MADKRLFEQAIEASPAYAGLQQRIAFGRAGQATKNMTLQNLIDWLKNQLSTTFLPAADNLKSLTNKATSRSNLGVYATTETYTQTEVNNLIAALNNKLGGLTILLSGTVESDGSYLKFAGSLPMSASRISEGRYQVIHSYGSGNYIVLASTASSSDSQNKVAAIEYGGDSFYVNTSDDETANDTAFRFVMFAF